MLLTRRAVHPAWGFGAGMASFWGGGVTCPACSFGAGIPLKYLQKNWNWVWWPPRCLQEPRVLLVGLLTGRVSGWLPLPKGKALCSCRGCSSNLWLVGEGRAAGHGLMAFFFLLLFLVESLSCFCHTNLSAPLEPCSWRRFLAWESSSRCLKNRTTALCHPMQQKSHRVGVATWGCRVCSPPSSVNPHCANSSAAFSAPWVTVVCLDHALSQSFVFFPGYLQYVEANTSEQVFRYFLLSN